MHYQRVEDDGEEPKIKAELPRFKKKKHHCSFTVDSSNGKVLVTEGKK